MKWFKGIFIGRAFRLFDKKRTTRKVFSGKNQISSKLETNINSADGLIDKIKENPETAEFIENLLKKYGNNPIPKIITNLVNEGFSEDSETISSILLAYIGEPATPHLINLLGDNHYQLGMFAAKTLASVENSLPQVIESMKSENSRIRLHAAGSLQFYGINAKEAIPALCELIKFEINNSVDIEPTNIPEAANNASGALGKMGEEALLRISDLLKEDNANIRLCAVGALSRIGKASLGLLHKSMSVEKDQLVLKALQKTIKTIESNGV